jgi:hypothetical protein
MRHGQAEVELVRLLLQTAATFRLRSGQMVRLIVLRENIRKSGDREIRMWKSGYQVVRSKEKHHETNRMKRGF